jgi:hypothetical protein
VDKDSMQMNLISFAANPQRVEQVLQGKLGRKWTSAGKKSGGPSLFLFN